MIQLGRFDEFGSGVINVHRHLPLYADGATPVFQETGHCCVTTLPLAVAQNGQVSQQVAPEVTKKLDRFNWGDFSAWLDFLLYNKAYAILI